MKSKNLIIILSDMIANDKNYRTVKEISESLNDKIKNIEDHLYFLYGEKLIERSENNNKLVYIILPKGRYWIENAKKEQNKHNAILIISILTLLGTISGVIIGLLK